MKFVTLSLFRAVIVSLCRHLVSGIVSPSWVTVIVSRGCLVFVVRWLCPHLLSPSSCLCVAIVCDLSFIIVRDSLCHISRLLSRHFLSSSFVGAWVEGTPVVLKYYIQLYFHWEFREKMKLQMKRSKSWCWYFNTNFLGVSSPTKRDNVMSLSDMAFFDEHWIAANAGNRKSPTNQNHRKSPTNKKPRK